MLPFTAEFVDGMFGGALVVEFVLGVKLTLPEVGPPVDGGTTILTEL